jgi:hypothetical protein
MSEEISTQRKQKAQKDEITDKQLKENRMIVPAKKGTIVKMISEATVDAEEDKTFEQSTMNNFMSTKVELNEGKPYSFEGIFGSLKLDCVEALKMAKKNDLDKAGNVKDTVTEKLVATEMNGRVDLEAIARS